MDRRLIFRRPHEKVDRRGDAGTTRVGVLDASVPQGRQHLIWKLFNPRPRKASSGRLVGPYRNPTQVC